MIRKSRSHLFFSLLLQATAVAIICVGSLINFHQYKIWGKPLIPQFVGYKRDVEDNAKVFSFSKLSRDHNLAEKYFAGTGCVLPAVLLNTPLGHCSFICFDLSQQVPAIIPLYSSGLRAPPLA